MPGTIILKLIFSLLLLFTIILSHAQTTTIKGIVRGEPKKEAIPFVNIGIKKKNVGTAADVNGAFSLRVGNSHLGDTLTFSAVGYHELSLPVKKIIADQEKEFILAEKPVSLQEVRVSGKAPKVRKIGTTSRNPLISGTAQRRNTDDISEFAKLIKINDKSAEVISATLYLQSRKLDSATFRINFYERAGGSPGRRIIEKSIIKRLPLNKGWTTIDLKQYGIFVDKDFFLSFEYLPDSSHQEKFLFSYGGALGGGTLSRQVSLGDWKQVSGATMAAYVTVMNLEQK